MRNSDPLTGLQRQKRVVGAFGLRSEHADSWVDRLGDGCATGQKAAPADGGDQRIERAHLLQQFQRGGTLPSHDHRMVERGHEGGSALLQNAGGECLAALGEAVVGHNLGPARAGRFHLRPRRVFGHDDGGLGPHVFRGDGGRLRMISRRVRYHAAGQRRFRQGQNQIRGATDLECPAALQVLALEEDARAGLAVESRRGKDGRLLRQGADALRRPADIVCVDCQVHRLEST